MSKLGRSALRGAPLLPGCGRARCSGIEFTVGGVEYYGCYGLMDWPDNYKSECQECGAFVDNLDASFERIRKAVEE